MATTTARTGPTRPRKTVPRKTATAAVPATERPTTERPTAERSTAERATAQPPARHPRAAAEHAARHNELRVSLPLLGPVTLPAGDELAFLAGVGVLAVVGAVEWPVAVLLGAGHALASRRGNKLLREFGEALERV